ncbi:hypothetical protein BwSF21_14820 [Bradyrhizobium ottawaense]|nr:hypothetical protein BwSF21_14820 [Bradyrhizobium ottawaense]
MESAIVSAVSRNYRGLTILADIEGYRTSLADAGAVGAGRNYDIVPVSVKPAGVFHPKISVLVAENGAVRATIGSGNLTFGGWGYNTEVLDVLAPERDSACFGDIAQFFEALGDHRDRISVERMPDLSPFIAACRQSSRAGGAGNSRVLHTMSEPLDKQLADMAADVGGAVSLTVVSPFFSLHHGVKQLAQKLSCDEVFVAVPPRAPEIFDFAASAAAGFRAWPVAADLFNDTRSLHAKLFEINCRRGTFVVTGSANATTPALSGRNVEAVVVRRFDKSYSFGWRPSGSHSGKATGERAPDELRGPCIVAHLNSSRISGRILGLADTKGAWSGLLSSGARRDPIGGITVDEEGRFNALVPSEVDPIARASSVQLILERKDTELRGWLVIEEMLGAVREKGPIARSLGRILSGTSASADIAAILQYLARTPEAALDAADRQCGARADRTMSPGLTSNIDASTFDPISAFDMNSRWRGGALQGSFDSLFDALLRRFASSLPDAEDDALDDEDEEELTASTRPSSRDTKKRAKRPAISLARKAFAAMFALLEQRPRGPDRVSGLYALFDMILQIAPRCDNADELTRECFAKWLAVARGCRRGQGQFSPLDRSVAAVLTKIVMEDPNQATIAHAQLQEWVGSEVDEVTKQSLTPNAERIDERRVAPGVGQTSWDAAWNGMLATTTPWAAVKALEKSMGGDGPLLFPNGLTVDEINEIRAVVNKDAKKDSVLIGPIVRGRNAACPRCNYLLPAVQRARLWECHVATCDNPRCHRVIINTSH